MTALLVLASGTSSRFVGGNKLLADLNGKSVAQHVIDCCDSLNFSARYAVISDPLVKDMFTAPGFTCLKNYDPSAGQGYAMSIGIQAIMAADADGLLVLLADMPFVEKEHIEKLLDTEGNVIMSESNGTRMPPCVFRGHYIKNLSDLQGDQGGKSAISTANVKTIRLSKRAAHDIDTVQDLEIARSL